jgi:hypothetical protein
MSDLREPIATEFDTTFYARTTGLVGTVAYKILDNDGNEIVGATTAGVTEIAAGLYAAKPTSPATVGEWSVVWSKDGTFDEHTLGVDALTTFDPGISPIVPPDLTPVSADGISSVGPCQLWATVDDVADYCSAEAAGSDASVYEEALLVATQVLHQLSARRFTGTCVRSVRPCTAPCGAAVPWPYTGGLFWGGDAWKDGYGRERGCGCLPLDSIPLAGAARAIVEVLIDGQIVDPDTYRLDERRRLVRMRDENGDRQFWPGCQNLDAEATEDGTFEITYEYGIDPPAAGVLAAKELACAIFSSSPAAALDEECVLPNGVTKIVRQGVTWELVADAGWGYLGKSRGWRTGLPLVDLFLNSYNPTGRR